jgi:hypothetical protein
MTKTVTVFGNEIDDQDSIALRLIPKLTKIFPTVMFIVSDPTESLEPPSDPWIIIDAAIGLEHVTLVTSLDDLEQVKGSSVHDFDVYMELRLQAKLKPLPQLAIILVPVDDEVEHAVEHVAELLSPLLRETI